MPIRLLLALCAIFAFGGTVHAQPFPAKPIRLVVEEGESRWQRARHEAIRIRRTIQEMVVRLTRRRRSVFFG